MRLLLFAFGVIHLGVPVLAMGYGMWLIVT